MEREIKTGFFVRHRTLSVVKTVQSVSEGMSFIVLRGCSHNIILNVHAPNEEKCDYSKDRFYEEMGQTFDHIPKYHTKILLGHFNAKLGRDDIFKPTNENESQHQASNNNGVRIVNCSTPKKSIY